MPESLKDGKVLNANFKPNGNFNANSNWNRKDRNPKMGGRSFLVGSCFTTILGIFSSLQAFCLFLVMMLGAGDIFYSPVHQYPLPDEAEILKGLNQLWIFLLRVVFYLAH